MDSGLGLDNLNFILSEVLHWCPGSFLPVHPDAVEDGSEADVEDEEEDDNKPVLCKNQNWFCPATFTFNIQILKKKICACVKLFLDCLIK